MFITRQKSVRRLAVLGLFAILAVAAVGFAALNTVPPSNAGDGSNVIGGYTVQNIHYVLDSADPQLLDEVEFEIVDPATGLPPVSVQARVNAGAFVACSNTASGGGVTDWECPLPGGTTVAAATSLQIVAAQ
jgi:hypothetical protein